MDLNINIAAKFAEFSDAMEKMSKQASTATGKIEKAFSTIKGTLATLGVGISLAGITAFVKSAINAQDEIGKMSQKIGVSAEGLSALAYSADLANVPLETLQGGLKKLAVGMVDMQAGTGEAKDAFKALKIEVEATKGNLKTSEQVLLEVADKFALMEDSAGKTAIAAKIFGARMGVELIPLLNAGAKGLRENADEAKRFGIIISTDATKKAEEFNDNLTRLSASSKGFGISIANELLPWLNNLVSNLLEANKIGGSFLGTLQLLGKQSFSQIIKNDPAQNIKDLQKEIADLKKPYTFAIRGKASVDARTAELEKQIEYETKLYELRLKDRDNFDPSLNKPPLTKAQVLPDEAALKRAQAAAEKAKRDADAASQAVADLAVARSKIIVDAEKAQASERLAVLDHLYQAGLIGEKRFWENRASTQQAAYDIERRAIEESIAARTKEQTRIGADPERGKKSKDYADATRDLNAEQARLVELTRAHQALGTTDLLARDKATADYQRAVKELNIELLELGGNTAEAARKGAALRNEGLRRQAQGRPDEAETNAALNQQEAAIDAQGRFNQLKEESSRVTAQLSLEEERIQNSRRVGAISEFDALQRTDASRQRAVQTLRLTVVELENVANAARLKGTEGFQNLVLDAERARVALETLEGSANSLADKFNTTISDSFADAFGDFITGTKKASEAFKSFANAVVNEMARMYAKQLAVGLMGGGASGGGGGVGGLLADLWRNLWGGSSNPSSAGLQFDYNQGFAMGTDYVPRTGLYKLHQGEAVIPAGENMGGGVTYAPTFNVDSRTDRADVIALMRREDQRTVATIADMTRRGGGYSKAVRG